MEKERMSMRWSDKLAIGMGIVVGASAIVYIGNSIWNQDSINKLAKQDIQRSRVEHNRQNAVLETVTEKNVRETGGDHHPEPRVFQRPHGVLA